MCFTLNRITATKQTCVLFWIELPRQSRHVFYFEQNYQDKADMCFILNRITTTKQTWPWITHMAAHALTVFLWFWLVYFEHNYQDKADMCFILNRITTTKQTWSWITHTAAHALTVFLWFFDYFEQNYQDKADMCFILNRITTTEQTCVLFWTELPRQSRHDHGASQITSHIRGIECGRPRPCCGRLVFGTCGDASWLSGRHSVQG